MRGIRHMRNGRMTWLCLIGVFLLFQAFPSPLSSCRAEEYTFEVSEFEKKPYHIGGYAEINPILFGLDRDASLYKLRFYNLDEGPNIEQYGGTLQLDGSYEKGIARGFVRTNSNLVYTYQGWSGETSLYEGFLSLKPSSSLTLDAGKRTMKWGKGYAWNPAAFVDRPKDPDDPTLALEGYFVASMDYTKSFSSGPLKTFSFTPVVLPEYGDVNDDFGESDHINVAAKAYFLLHDTDIDFMFLAGGSKTPRYGFDFSRNLGSNLEVHGEFAFINDFQQTLIDANGNTYQNTSNAINYVLGIRYLSTLNTTYILEYYQQGTGVSSSEMSDYFSFIDKGYNAFLSSGDTRALAKAATLTRGNYGGFTPETNYLYLRASQPEPFDTLYFTPALTWIFNLDDRSFSLTPELLYTPITNLELRLRTGVLVGAKDTEFGEKQNDYRVELRVRYYF